MDLEKIKAQIATFKDKAIDNVERNFNDYILEDLIEYTNENSDYYLIDSMNYYLYWLELAIDLNPIIKNLTSSFNRDKSYKIVLNEYLQLKAEVDKKLIYYYSLTKNENQTNLIEIGEDISNEISINTKSITEPIEIQESYNQNDALLDSLYHLLRNEWKSINCESGLFKEHFYIKRKMTNRITWNDKTETLLALIKELIKSNIIINNLSRQQDICLLISQHFINKHNKPFKLPSLRTTYPIATCNPNKKMHLDRFIRNFRE
nr:hypothetical protein [uncultured Draconibacterium sp.]